MPIDLDLEKQIEDMNQALKNEANLSAWKNDRQTASVLNLLASLRGIPKNPVPHGDLMRVKDQILDRISVPAVDTSAKAGFALGFSKFLRLGTVALAGLVLLLGSGAGVAAAALNSLPGQTFYPLKKVVENIELRLAPDNKKTALQIKFADNRMNELQSVLDQKDSGQLTAQETQKIISQTVKDLQKTTTAAAAGATDQPKVVNKLADLSDKLQAASVQSEGEVKIELEKAVQTTKMSQDEAIANLHRAGIKLENDPIILDDSVHASGKLTAVSATALSIGTAKFLITKDTKYEGLEAGKLAVDQMVEIEAQIIENKTVAQKITLLADKQAVSGEQTEQDETDTKTETPSAH